MDLVSLLESTQGGKETRWQTVFEQDKVEAGGMLAKLVEERVAVRGEGAELAGDFVTLNAIAICSFEGLAELGDSRLPFEADGPAVQIDMGR